MPSYVAFIRGINVSGKNLIKMDALRKSMEGLSFKDIKTYIQSGNIVFQTRKTSTYSLIKKIESKIKKDFKAMVTVLVLKPGELARIIKANPFVKKTGVDPNRLYITFLASSPTRKSVQSLDSVRSKADQIEVIQKAAYLYCPNGYGQSKLNNNVLEKRLLVSATTRNWKTVNVVYQMTLTKN